MPPDAAVGDAAVVSPETRQQEWLTGKLIGGDNRMAARRVVTITRKGECYELFMKNQFLLRCALTFDTNGDPARLERCKSGDSADWDATGPITLKCRDVPNGRLCAGAWRSRNGIVAPDTLSFQLQRPGKAVLPAQRAKPKAERECGQKKNSRCVSPGDVQTDDF
jgi:hypothetical protein